VTGEALGFVVVLQLVKGVDGVDVGRLIGTRTAQRQLRAQVLARYAMKAPQRRGRRRHVSARDGSHRKFNCAARATLQVAGNRQYCRGD
jgi:hypothetical protein